MLDWREGDGRGGGGGSRRLGDERTRSERDGCDGEVQARWAASGRAWVNRVLVQVSQGTLVRREPSERGGQDRGERGERGLESLVARAGGGLRGVVEGAEGVPRARLTVLHGLLAREARGRREGDEVQLAPASGRRSPLCLHLRRPLRLAQAHSPALEGSSRASPVPPGQHCAGSGSPRSLVVLSSSRPLLRDSYAAAAPRAARRARQRLHYAYTVRTAGRLRPICCAMQLNSGSALGASGSLRFSTPQQRCAPVQMLNTCDDALALCCCTLPLKTSCSAERSARTGLGNSRACSSACCLRSFEPALLHHSRRSSSWRTRTRRAALHAVSAPSPSCGRLERSRSSLLCCCSAGSSRRFGCRRTCYRGIEHGDRGARVPAMDESVSGERTRRAKAASREERSQSFRGGVRGHMKL